ncbi:MAG: PAS domain-containing protein, partial [Phycisphaerales bacterium]|nr:PAS domain-containing protein [Phycisphaerales bacterium]
MSTPPDWLPPEMSALWDAFATDPMIGVWAVDAADFRVIFADETAAHLIARTAPEAVVGLSVRHHAPDPVADRLCRLLDHVVSTGTPIIGQAVWQGRRVRSTFSPLGDEEGRVERILVVTRPAPADAPEREVMLVDEAEYCHLGPLDKLTTRELEVLAYLGQGLSI